VVTMFKIKAGDSIATLLHAYFLGIPVGRRLCCATRKMSGSTGGGQVSKMQTAYVNGPRAGHREVPIAAIATRCPLSMYTVQIGQSE
jgi:hypothetical protein